MTLKLYGSPSSTCTKRVATVLHEKSVPFVLVKVDMSKAEHKSEEHLKIQPFGQVPVLEVSQMLFDTMCLFLTSRL